MASFPGRSSSPVPPVAGVKRRAASLLPAFDPLSSSPGLPRPLKRSRDALTDSKEYPTPVPTSSTHVLSSSPYRNHAHAPASRTVSALSERAPLSDVPSIDLPEDGTPVLMGRSSVSSDYQLSANRLISRVHVKAVYKAAISSLSKDRIEIHCEGWNGAKVHCLGKPHFIHKGEIFTSEDRNASIMVDVHEARVMVRWPAKKEGSETADTLSAWGDENSPRRSVSPTRRRSFATSPLRQRQRIASPVSPSPAVAALAPSSPFLPVPPSSPPPVEIYEDESAEEAVLPPIPAITQESTQVMTQPLQDSQLRSQSLQDSIKEEPQSLQSSLSEAPEDFSDHDEENDPIIHSFGPFGANLLGSMASFKTTDSPLLPPAPPRAPIEVTQPAISFLSSPRMDHIRSHVINQLAFSRVHSTPLSTIISNLPKGEDYVSGEIRAMILETKCLGEITREGKDAAGKPLESEFYYIPEDDDDEMRKGAVLSDLGRTGIRSCRKQHKQYYWKKPKAK